MTEAINHLGKIALALFEEKKHEEGAYRKLIAEVSVSERKANGSCWSPLSIRKKSFALGGRPLLIVERNPSDKHEHGFQSGSPVFIFNSDQNGERGIVQSVRGNEMAVALFAEDFPVWVDEDLLGVEISFDSRSFKEMELTLNKLINTDEKALIQKRERITGVEQPRFNNAVSKTDNPGLNESQINAINHILRAEDLAIVHGPPGTGKTTTLAAATTEILNTEDQVLATAPSNSAVDLLALKIHQTGVNVVRVGELSRIDEDLRQISLDQLVQNHESYIEITRYKRQASELRKKAEKYKRNFGQKEREERKKLYAEARILNKEAFKLEDYLVEKILDDAQVIASTLIGASYKSIRNREFSTVLIDEAGQSTEPATWVAAIRGKRVVLAGDHFQLPPTVKSADAGKQGLLFSLLERCMILNKPDSMLKVQYRMNNDIMSFSNKEFYNSELRSASIVAEDHIADGYSPVEFIDTAGCGYNEQNPEGTKSKYNTGEIELIEKRLIDLFESHDSSSWSVGVLSPYKEQVNRLTDRLHSFLSVEVNTIDGFQGREADVIIISLVRSNEEGQIGFLKDFRRMNVALTRARKKLIVIGDSSTIGQEAFYGRFLDYVESSGSYRSGWEWI